MKKRKNTKFNFGPSSRISSICHHSLDLGFSHLLFARQLWERNEKLGKSHRPFFAPMKAALVKKMPEIDLKNDIVYLDKKRMIKMIVIMMTDPMKAAFVKKMPEIFQLDEKDDDRYDDNDDCEYVDT